MNRLPCQSGCLLILILALLGPGAAAQTPNALPGHEFHERAVLAYNRQDWGSAMEMFELSAWWGDKLSQFNIGIMHYQGQGRPVDRARAWAWLALSAERGYKRMEATAAYVWNELSESEQAAADALHRELLARYGDAITVPRAQRRMESERRKVVGSRVGSAGLVQIFTPGSNQIQDGLSVYSRGNYDYLALIEAEGQMLEANDRRRVELRELRLIDD